MVVGPRSARAVAAALLCAWFAVPRVAFAQDASAQNPAAQGAPAPAQNGSADASTPRRILVAVEKGLLAGVSDDDLGILERSFLTMLSAAEGAPATLAFGNGTFPSAAAAREKAARDRGADAWLLLTIGGGTARPVLRVSSYDLLYQVTTLSFTINRVEPFPIMDIDRELWGDVIPRILAAYPAILPAAYNRGPVTPAPVTVRALPGTIVTGLTAKPVVVGKDGTASLQIPSPFPYTLRATLGGYIPVTRTIYFNSQPEIVVQQERSPWLLLDFTLLDGFFPGVSGTAAFSPFPGFVRLGFTTFRAGLAVNQDSLLTSLPLSQLTLHLGLYLSPEDSPTRWYIGAGGLLRLSLPPGGELTVDALMPWGVQAIAGVELSFTAKLRTFVELTPSFYLTPLPWLLTAYLKDNGFPYIAIGNTGALDPVELRLGLRWVP